MFYCQQLLETEDLEDVLDTFQVKEESGQGLAVYLKEHAINDEITGEARTYLVRDKENHELVGYFSVKAGMVSINERISWFKPTFDSVPGVELSNFAVNSSYREAHEEYEGLGKIIFSYFILPIVKEVSQRIGVYLLYIFALPYKRLIENYKEMNFVRLSAFDEYFIHRRIKPRYDKNCIFMCQNI